MAENVRIADNRATAQKKMSASVKILRYIFKDVDGRDVSLQHRKAAKDNNSEKTNDAHLTYGEVNAQSFLQILALVHNLDKSADCSQPKVFVDLGCGTGLAVLCAALSPFGFCKVWGIELVPGLTHEALRCQERLVHLIQHPNSIASTSNASKPAAKKGKIDESNVDSAVFQILNEHLAANNISTTTVESFANLLCKELGHKTYKALIIKTHKTFIKYLKTSDRFLLSENDTVVQPTPPSDSNSSNVDANTETTLLNSTDIPGSSSSSSGGVSIKLEAADLQLYSNSLPEIVFETNDIFQVDWYSTADVVYAASLLFSEDMMVQLSEQVHRMKSGSYFINLRELPPCSDSSSRSGRRVELVSESFFKMSWQMAKVYIYRIS